MKSCVLKIFLVLLVVELSLASQQMKVTVYSEPSSHVGGYYPLGLEFTTLHEFPKNGFITLSNVHKADNYESCDKLVMKLEPFGNNFECMAFLWYTDFFVSTERLEAGITIRIELNRIQYNTEKAPRRIRVSITDFNSSIVTDRGENSYDWIPQYAAQLLAFKAVYDIHSCCLFDLTVTGITTLAITVQHEIMITFNDNIDLSASSTSDLKDSGIQEKSIFGYLSRRHIVGSTISIKIKNLKILNVLRSFNVTLFIYSPPGHEVFENTAEVFLKTLKTVSYTRGIELINNKGICNKGLYKVELESCFRGVPNAKFEVIPSIDIFGNQQINISSNELFNEFKVIYFELTNPCFIIPKAKLLSYDFTINVYNGDTDELELIINSRLSNHISYMSGVLMNIEVVPEYPGYDYECSYTFFMTNTNAIPLGGKVTLTLNPFIEFTKYLFVTVNGIQTALDYSQGVISVEIPMNINPLTKITLVIGNFKNPPEMGIYSGFVARSFNELGYMIDESSSASVKINKPGFATVLNSISNLRNLEKSEYTFTFMSGTIPISNEEILGIKVPAEVTDCSLVDALSTTPPNTDVTMDFWLKVEEPLTESLKNNLEFKLSCTNPSITSLTNSFEFTLFKSDGSELLRGNTKIQTKEGSYLDSGSSIQCDKTCPRCNTICTLNVKRKGKTGFRTLVISNDRFDLSKVDCSYNENGLSYSSTCINLQDELENKIKLTLGTIREVSTIQIVNLHIIYPEYSPILSYPLTIRTYSTEDINSEALIDEDEVLVIAGKCDYPCKSCSEKHNKCDSCTDDLVDNKQYYLYPEDTENCSSSTITNCRILEDNLCCSVYYKDEINRQCLKCNSACEECEGSVNNCTKCKDNSKFLYEGKCKDKCDEGTYPYINICIQCEEGCKSCLSGEECVECEDGFYKNNQSCVRECPEGTYLNGSVCELCDSNCASCVESSTKCTKCPQDKAKRYLHYFSGKCVNKNTCENEQLSTDDNEKTCAPCSSDCEECKGEATFCTKCKNNKLLKRAEGICISTCEPDAYSKPGVDGIGGICFTCEDNMVYDTTTKKCISFCPGGYYESNKECYPCNSTCASCNNFNTCISCVEGYFLYKGKCYTEHCPHGSFNSIKNLCEDCDILCSTCRNNKYSCIDCSYNAFVSNDQCVSSCPIGTISIGDKCEPCSSSCYECNERIDICTKCHSRNYLFQNECLNICPMLTTASLTFPKTCIDCALGCEKCTWNNVCITCLPEYKYLNSMCYSACPEDYLDSKDELACVSALYISPESAYYYKLPYPHLIVVGVLAALLIFRQPIDFIEFINTNFIILLSYATIVSYISLLIMFESMIEILVLTGLVLIIQIALNFHFLWRYRESIASDSGFRSWADFHYILKYLLLILSAIFSFQNFRLLYSKSRACELFSAKFRNYNTLFKMLDYSTLLQIILVLGIVSIFTCAKLISFSLGTVNHIFIVESFVLSLLLIISLFFEMRSTKVILEMLKSKGNSVMLRDRPGTIPNIFTEEAIKNQSINTKMFDPSKGTMQQAEEMRVNSPQEIYKRQASVRSNYNLKLISFKPSSVNPDEDIPQASDPSLDDQGFNPYTESILNRDMTEEWNRRISIKEQKVIIEGSKEESSIRKKNINGNPPVIILHVKEEDESSLERDKDVGDINVDTVENKLFIKEHNRGHFNAKQ